MNELKIIVTGGGTGIGFASAQEFSRAGARVSIWGRREDVLRDAVKRLGENASYEVCDIRQPEQVESACAGALKKLGGVNTLVNNAGGQFPSPAVSMSPRGFEAVIRNNLLGTFNVTQIVAKAAMIPQSYGCILNVIANVERGFPGMAHTGAARAGVENLTKSLAIEWMPHRIRVNAVAPGIIRTSGTEQYGDELFEKAVENTPLGRAGTADEVAGPIVFLCSEAARFITGETLYVDGGARLWGETWPLKEMR